MPLKKGSKKPATPTTRHKTRRKISIGDAIDKLYELRAERIALQKQADEVRSRESELKSQVIQMMQETGQTRAAGVGASASVSIKQMPRIEDWTEVYRYISRRKAFHLLQKRFNVGALRELWDDGKEIPGVVPESMVDMSLTKISR